MILAVYHIPDATFLCHASLLYQTSPDPCLRDTLRPFSLAIIQFVFPMKPSKKLLQIIFLLPFSADVHTTLTFPSHYFSLRFLPSTNSSYFHHSICSLVWNFTTTLTKSTQYLLFVLFSHLPCLSRIGKHIFSTTALILLFFSFRMALDHIIGFSS